MTDSSNISVAYVIDVVFIIVDVVIVVIVIIINEHWRHWSRITVLRHKQAIIIRPTIRAEKASLFVITHATMLC